VTLTNLAVVLLLQTSASTPSAEEAAPHKLRFNWVQDAAIAAAGLLTVGATETVLKPHLAPEPCRWCDEDLNGVDAWGRNARWALESQLLADTLSNASNFLVLPLAVFATQGIVAHGDGALGYLGEDIVMVVQAVTVAAVVNQGVKFLAGRERPFVHALPANEKLLTPKPDDNNLSFYSGHASWAMSLAVSAGTVAELRGYRGRHWIWIVGLPLAATVPYLRMAADRHYLTDVLVGSVAGAAFGFALPYFLHGRTDGNVSVAVSGNGASVRVVF
jgi:membrane-associated phospholipid phosphatase